MIEARAVIVGAGFAGGSTAFHLARRGIGRVVVVERERRAGVHSSGRNAAMVRQVVAEPAIAGLARQGARAIQALSSAPEPVEFRARGSLLLASGARLETLRREADLAREAGLPAEWWSRAQAVARVPVLSGADFEGGCFCPSDGVVDIAALLQHYLRGAEESGAQVVLGEEAVELVVEGGKVAGIRTGDVVVRAPAVVDAAGAWAGRLGAEAGGLRIPMRALRRHLVFTGRFPRASPDWPFVWDVAHEVYFRPESDGLLLSPCDESECAPGIPEVDPAAIELLSEKVRRHLPGLGDLPVARSWAGLRSFAPDGRFVIGPDPALPGLFWAAGLGGHGVTSSAGVGALAAELVERPERDAGNPFSPARFASARGAPGGL
jgi:D-arginine dehydrogenase